MNTGIERRQILLLGRVNSGKSSLFNRLLRQERSIVSQQEGTTTDTVSKAIELPRIGASILIDTPGLADSTPLGDRRMAATRQALRSADLVLYLVTSAEEIDESLLARLRQSATPVILVWSKADQRPLSSVLSAEIALRHGLTPIAVSGDTGDGVDALLGKMADCLAESLQEPSLLGGLCSRGDLVLLVMPQDDSAPQGRLILPQVQTIRALLDRGCHPLCTTPEEMSATLAQLLAPPALIITDSQVFAQVESLSPRVSRLTSFSILMSAHKGDLPRLVAGARTLGQLSSTSRILIAEACAHAPQGEDIGTVKLPRMLRKRFGSDLQIDHVSGRDFPDDLTPYDLIIHCGACMFNRRHLLSRQDSAEQQTVPMTNYGLAIAYLTGILDRVDLP